MRSAAPLTVVAGLVALAALAAAGALVYAYSGRYDVAAVDPEPGAVDSAWAAIAERSIARHAAAGPAAPASPPADPSALRRGAALYDRLCAGCHGAPGRKPSEVGMGLNPGAPDLVDAMAAMPAHRARWVIENGIRMSGMPGFRPSLDAAQLDALVGFAEALPRMTPEGYRRALAPAAPPPNPG